MFNMNKSLNKMMGKNLQIPKLISGRRSMNDSDGDGIPNSKDCQKRNLLRQDPSRPFKMDNNEYKLEMKRKGIERDIENLLDTMHTRYIKTHIKDQDFDIRNNLSAPENKDLYKLFLKKQEQKSNIEHMLQEYRVSKGIFR